MALAWRLPALLATPGNLHHHDFETPSFQASLSWCRNLAPYHLLRSSSSSTSTATHSYPPFNRDQYLAFHEMCGQGGSWGCESCSGDTRQNPSILVVGATETLGRQTVRRAVDGGYVRCLVRPRPTPAGFLRDRRATVVNVDWEGKVALIQCAKAMGIHKFVFYSIHNCDKHPEVPLMEIKYCTEKCLLDSCINHVIIRLCGFMQLGNYWTVCSIAMPILEEKSVWGTDAPTRIAYMDTQFNHALTVSPDVAPLTFIGLRNEKVSGKLLTFAGPRAWTTQEVITLCERFAGQEANITRVPVSVLRVTRQLTRLFECTNDVADRMAFSEVLVIFVELNESFIFLKQGLPVGMKFLISYSSLN